MENTRQRRNKGLLAPLLLILVGIVLLLERNGILDRHMIWQWLPLLPLLIGGFLLLTRIKRRTDE